MENIEEKQNYLRENILEKGYDAEKFMIFLTSKKGEQAADLNIWSFEELKACVSEFTSQQQDNAQQPSVPIEEQGKNLQEGEDNQISQENEGEKENGNELVRKPTEPYKEKIKCAKNEETDLSKASNVTITLSYPEKVEGGIFSKSYVTYLVTTLPFDFKVRKRYSDFEWLRSMLQSIYIGSVIPPIPRKNYGDRFNEFFISKRMRSLEKFMQGLAVDPLLRSSKILFDFLTTENEQEWNNKKAAYNKMKTPTQLAEIKTLTGEMNLNITSEQEMYFSNIKDNVNNNENLIKKLLVSYKNLLCAMIDVSSKMHETSEIWKQLYQNSERP